VTTLITESARRIAEETCAQMGIQSGIHDEDQLLAFIIKDFGEKFAIESYFHHGRSDAYKIAALIQSLPFSNEQPEKKIRVLDFASGFGRVVRHLPNLMAKYNISAADIHPAACEFINTRFNIPTFLSSTKPGDLNVGNNYDYVYAMSLFSHLPDEAFGPWLKALYNILSPGGYLIFTVHGTATLDRRSDFFAPIYDKAKGFGYLMLSEQNDLDSVSYGTMIVGMEYMSQAFNTFVPDARIYQYRYGEWFGHQDEWIIKKPI